MGWKIKAKTLLDRVQETVKNLQVELTNSTELLASLEDFGDENLREQVKELYDYLEGNAYNEADPEDDEEDEEDEFEED